MCIEQKVRYVTSDELFTSPEASYSLEEAARAFVDEINETILDTVQLRQQEDWNFLANRVVGAEDLSEIEAHSPIGSGQ